MEGTENLQEENINSQELQQNEQGHVSFEDDVIKVDFRNLNKTEDAVQEQNTDEGLLEPEESEIGLQEVGGGDEESEELTNNEESQEVITPESVMDEVTDEEVQEAADNLSIEVEEAVAESKNTGADLPENIQKVIDFMNETGGSLEDYVRLNTDYSKLDDDMLLIEYYQATRPDLDADDIAFLIEDSFMFDEDIDDDKDIRRKKLARKEELKKAKGYLEGLKEKYYQEIKAGSKLTPDQQKAIEFFNRYNKETEETQKVAEKQVQTFLNKTKEVFSGEFKGFDYSTGDKRYRINIKDANEVMTAQSDINNFVKKFLNKDGEIADAKGYHKALFAAMNPDLIAKHFYEQGKADAVRDSMARTKNIDMSPRGTHEDTPKMAGFSIKSVDGVDASKLRVKFNK